MHMKGTNLRASKPRRSSKKPAKRVSRSRQRRSASAPGRRKAKNPRFERRLSLTDVPGVRRSLARLSREYLSNTISEKQLRALTYSLRAVLSALELEQNARIEERLTALEGKVKEIASEAAR